MATIVLSKFHKSSLESLDKLSCKGVWPGACGGRFGNEEGERGTTHAKVCVCVCVCICVLWVCCGRVGGWVDKYRELCSFL